MTGEALICFARRKVPSGIFSDVSFTTATAPTVAHGTSSTLLHTAHDPNPTTTRCKTTLALCGVTFIAIGLVWLASFGREDASLRRTGRAKEIICCQCLCPKCTNPACPRHPPCLEETCKKRDSCIAQPNKSKQNRVRGLAEGTDFYCPGCKPRLSQDCGENRRSRKFPVYPKIDMRTNRCK